MPTINGQKLHALINSTGKNEQFFTRSHTMRELAARLSTTAELWGSIDCSIPPDVSLKTQNQNGKIYDSKTKMPAIVGWHSLHMPALSRHGHSRTRTHTDLANLVYCKCQAVKHKSCGLVVPAVRQERHTDTELWKRILKIVSFFSLAIFNAHWYLKMAVKI